MSYSYTDDSVAPTLTRFFRLSLLSATLSATLLATLYHPFFLPSLFFAVFPLSALCALPSAYPKVIHSLSSVYLQLRSPSSIYYLFYKRPIFQE